MVCREAGPLGGWGGGLQNLGGLKIVINFVRIKERNFKLELTFYTIFLCIIVAFMPLLVVVSI